MTKIQKTQKRTEVSPNRYRYRICIVGFPCHQGTNEARIQQYNLLRQISDEPHLLVCGPVLAERVVIRHNGEGWIVEAEAEVEESVLEGK
jgi:hypothetical protein